jgi:hypothetical protein
VAGDGAGLVLVAGIHGGLAAAGLAFRDVNRVSEALKDLGDGEGDVGTELVHETGDKEGDAHVGRGSA